METWVWIVIIVIFFIIVAVVVYFVYPRKTEIPATGGGGNVVNAMGVTNPGTDGGGGGSSNWWIWLIAAIFVIIIIIVLVVAFWGGSKEVVVPPVVPPPVVIPVVSGPVIESMPEPIYASSAVQPSPSQIHFHEQIHFHGTGTDEFNRTNSFSSNEAPTLTSPNPENIDVYQKGPGTFPPEARNGLEGNMINRMRPQAQFSGQGRGAIFDPNPERRMFVQPGTSGQAVVMNQNGKLQQGRLTTPARVTSTYVDPPPRPVEVRG